MQLKLKELWNIGNATNCDNNSIVLLKFCVCDLKKL